MRHLRRLLAASLAIAVLGGCGGGGNSGPSPLSITASSPPAGTTGAAYASYTFTASGGTSPVTWTESGSLPGLTLSASGQLSGVPATAGTFPISVTVTDSSMPPLTTSASISLKVSDSKITVAPASPPTGALNYAYPEFTFSANGGSPPYTWAATGTLPPGLTLGTNGSLSGTPTQAGTFSFSVTPTDSAQIPVKGPALSVQVIINAPLGAGAFIPTSGEMTVARARHTATLLHDGTVLITGGCTDGGGSLASAEVFHPATGTFTPTANNMSTSRCSHTATLLNNQQVLVTGGGGTSADLYDPSTGRFSPTGNMGTSRSAPTATFLKDGTVLITGGEGSGGYLASAEVFDPTTGLFTPTAGNMTTVRWGHTATSMADSRVLVTGGIGTWAVGGGYLRSAEIYDPASRTFTLTGSMHYKRWWHTATLLGDGNVLVVGGEDVFRTVTASAELFNPANGVFMAAAGMADGRRSHTATLLTDGRVLITGGEWFNSTGGIPSLASAGLYDPSGTTFTPTSNMLTPRSEHTATRLNDGSVLVAGGIDWTSQARTVLASAELYY